MVRSRAFGGFLLACLMAFGIGHWIGTRQGALPGHWSLREGKPDIYGHKIFVLSLAAGVSVLDRLAASPAVLAISCRTPGGGPRVHITFRRPLSKSAMTSEGLAELVVREDGGRPYPQEWVPSQDGETVFTMDEVGSDSARVRYFSSLRTLTVQADLAGVGPQIVTFDLVGLDRALSVLSSRCGRPL